MGAVHRVAAGQDRGDAAVTEQPIGPLLDALGVTIGLEPDQQITEVVVIGKLVHFGSGATRLFTSSSEGLDWIAQLGLIAAAKQVCNADPPTPAE